MRQLDEKLPNRSHLVPWFKRMTVTKEKIGDILDRTLDPDEETYQSICKVAALAGHYTARKQSQRSDMEHAVNILAPMVEQWMPTVQRDDTFNIDFSMSVPQALQKWKANEDSSMLSEGGYGGYSISSRTSKSILRKLSDMDNHL